MPALGWNFPPVRSRKQRLPHPHPMNSWPAAPRSTTPDGRGLPEQWSEEHDIEELAEAAAEDYWRNWRNHDGWEARWPLTFEILLPNGEVLGTCSVSLDMEPVFVVTTHNA